MGVRARMRNMIKRAKRAVARQSHPTDHVRRQRRSMDRWRNAQSAAMSAIPVACMASPR
jgi:hypothetical protein